MRITLKLDSRGLNPFRDRSIERAVAKAAKKAGGDAIRKMRTQSSRQVREQKRFKLKATRDGLPVFFPQGQNLADLEWTMRVSGAPSRVIDFPVRELSKGVKPSINRGKKGTLIESAFVATMKSGHRGVFVRRADARLPIDELHTTRLSHVFENKGFPEKQLNTARDVFASAFDRLLPLELAKVVPGLSQALASD